MKLSNLRIRYKINLTNLSSVFGMLLLFTYALYATKSIKNVADFMLKTDECLSGILNLSQELEKQSIVNIEEVQHTNGNINHLQAKLLRECDTLWDMALENWSEDLVAPTIKAIKNLDAPLKRLGEKRTEYFRLKGVRAGHVEKVKQLMDRLNNPLQISELQRAIQIEEIYFSSLGQYGAAKLEESKTLLDDITGSLEESFYDDINGHLKEYNAVVSQLLTVLPQMMDALKMSRDQIRVINDTFIEGLQGGKVNTNRVINLFYVALFVMMAGLFLILFILVRLVSRNISLPIQGFNAHLKDLAEGHLKLDEESKNLLNRKDEIGDIARQLHLFTNRVRNVVQSTVETSENVFEASVSLTTVSQAISSGSTEQAAASEEASAAMEQMAANITQNADNASQAELVSRKSSETLQDLEQRGAKSISSVRSIADKIGIVNEIASQTNILALNAAVEAARAGDHGRGFAVVAAEVRKLAERSAIAANEVVTLATAALQDNEETNRLIVQLAPEVKQSTLLLREVTVSSAEQRNGAEQINSAVQQLNSVAQSNALSSQQMATNAENLKSQAQSLKDIVAYFKL